MEFLDACGGQGAIAIDNARLFSATDQALTARVDELTMLQRIDRQLNETLDTDKAMSITLQWASRVCNAKSATMGLRDGDESILPVVSHSGEPDAFAHEPTIDLNHVMVTHAI